MNAYMKGIRIIPAGKVGEILSKTGESVVLSMRDPV